MDRQHFPKVATKQQGVVTLIMAIVLLTLVTFIAFYTSKTVFLEQKITNNDVRGRQAFEVAEAGLAAAATYLKNPDRNDDGFVDVNVFDTNGDGIGDSNTDTIAGGSVTVTIPANLALTDFIPVTAVGRSDDGTATRTINQLIVKTDPLPNVPQNPMTTRGTVVIQGSATVHNQEGHSTIWSGGDVDLGSNNSTSTEVPDVADAGYPSCMDISDSCELMSSSNKVTIGLDIIEHDSSLSNLSAEELFENFFGMPPDAYRDSQVTMDLTGAEAGDVHLAQNEVIWIEGDATFPSVTVGCTESVTGNNKCPASKLRPSILIVDGNATFSGGTSHIYGIVFIMGSANMSKNTTVRGAVVTAGAVSNTGGSLDVWYNSSILAATRNSGSRGGAAGTWRDFQ
jgi:Tfp pilus assembly protein PilX